MRALTFLLLILGFTASGQKPQFPRWQQQAMIYDLVRGRECDSAQWHLIKINNELKSEIEAGAGIQVQLQSQVDNYEFKIVPQLEAEVNNNKEEAVIYRAQARKYRRQRNLVVAVVVVVEVLRIVTGHP